MLAFSDAVVAVSEASALNEALRFSVPRLTEYLDTGVHFSQSASFRPGVLSVLAEIDENGATYLEEGSALTPRTIINRACDTLDYLDRSERLLAGWFPSEHTAVMDSLRAVAAASTNSSTLNPKVERLIEDTRALRAFAEDPTTGYGERLIELVEGSWRVPPSDERAWRSFDRDLLDLGAHLLGIGRSGEAVGLALADAVAEARDDGCAIAAADAVLRSSRRAFSIVVVLCGATQVEGSAALGCVRLGSPAEWGEGNQSNDRRLRRFLTSRRDGRKRCAFKINLQAWDAEDARDEALALARLLTDRVTAAHRTSQFELLDDALVVERASGQLSEFAPRTDMGPRTAHMLPGTHGEQLRASLRYAGLSRVERLPVVSVMHAWIAMECLAEGARAVFADGSYGDLQRPATYLPKRLAALMSLAGVANLWPRSWDIASRTGRHPCRSQEWLTLASWFGDTSNPDFVPSLSDWAEVLVAAHDVPSSKDTLEPGAGVDEAAAYLRHLLQTWPPYPRRRLAESARLLSRGKALDEWATRLYDQSLANVRRFQLTRHLAVHTAAYEIAGSKHLALAAQAALDALYEVLPPWIMADQAPWQALDEVFRWRRALFRVWKKREDADGFKRPYELDARRITRREAV